MIVSVLRSFTEASSQRLVCWDSFPPALRVSVIRKFFKTFLFIIQNQLKCIPSTVLDIMLVKIVSHHVFTGFCSPWLLLVQQNILDERFKV